VEAVLAAEEVVGDPAAQRRGQQGDGRQLVERVQPGHAQHRAGVDHRDSLGLEHAQQLGEEGVQIVDQFENRHGHDYIEAVAGQRPGLRAVEEHEAQPRPGIQAAQEPVIVMIELVCGDASRAARAEGRDVAAVSRPHVQHVAAGQRADPGFQLVGQLQAPLEQTQSPAQCRRRRPSRLDRGPKSAAELGDLIGRDCGGV